MQDPSIPNFRNTSNLQFPNDQWSMTNFPWLTTIILFPIVAALFIPLVPDKGDGKTVRWYSLVVGLIDFVLIV